MYNFFKEQKVHCVMTVPSGYITSDADLTSSQEQECPGNVVPLSSTTRAFEEMKNMLGNHM